MIFFQCDCLFERGILLHTSYVTQVLSLVRHHHVKIEPDFTNLVVSIVVLEGLGRQLNPDLDLFAAARPFLRFREKG